MGHECNFRSTCIFPLWKVEKYSWVLFAVKFRRPTDKYFLRTKHFTFLFPKSAPFFLKNQLGEGVCGKVFILKEYGEKSRHCLTWHKGLVWLQKVLKHEINTTLASPTAMQWCINFQEAQKIKFSLNGAKNLILYWGRGQKLLPYWGRG